MMRLWATVLHTLPYCYLMQTIIFGIDVLPTPSTLSPPSLLETALVASALYPAIQYQNP
jgi:hypothetical protein